MAASPRSLPSGTGRDAAIAEVALVMLAIGAAWGFSKLLLYPALGVPDNAPVILRPILGFLAAWWLLRRAGLDWASLGLTNPAGRKGLAIAAAVAVGLYLANLAISAWVLPLLAQWFPPTPGPSFLAYIRGNLPGFLLWAAIGWIVGGFMEECLFRGFLLTRVERACGGGPTGVVAGIGAQALLFGALHLYQGPFGFAFAGTFALASGAAYVLGGRNLWPLIIVLGTWNTVGIWSVYSAQA